MTTSENDNIYEDIFSTDSDSEDEEELNPVGVAHSMLSSQVQGSPEKDVGKLTNEKTKTSDESEIISANQHTLNEIFKIVG